MKCQIFYLAEHGFVQSAPHFFAAFFAVQLSHAFLSVHFVQADLSAFFAVHAEQAAFLLSAFFALHPQLPQASAVEPATIRATIAIPSTFLIIFSFCWLILCGF